MQIYDTWLPLKSPTQSAITMRIIRGSRWEVIGSMMLKVRTRRRPAMKMTAKHLNTCQIRHKSQIVSNHQLRPQCLSLHIHSMRILASFYKHYQSVIMLLPRNLNRRKLIKVIQLSIRATRVFTKKRNLSSNLQILMATNSNSATIACSRYLSRAVCKGTTKW